MEDFEDIDLPNRLIAAGEEPLGERVNAYQKMKTLRSIFDALDEAEKTYISSTQFGKLLEFPNLPSFLVTFVLFLLSRQLEVVKSNEIWFVFSGTPVRLSLREFKIVTGLRCDKFPTVQKKRKKNTAGKKIPFYSTLFGLEEDVTVERVITMLKKRTVTDELTRRMYACLAIVDGYLVPTSHYPKILKEHAEMCEDFDSFLSYPWGRLSFQMMMTSIKERDVEQLATTSVAVQGLVYAIQLVVLYAAPSIQDGPPADGNNASESEAESPAERIAAQAVSFKLGNAKEIDKNCTANVDPIIRPDVEEEMITEDLTWSDEDEDERVDNIVSLAKHGFKFTNDMFQGGCIPCDVQVAPEKQKRVARGKVVRSRKSHKGGRPQPSSKQASSSKESLSVPRYVDINSLSRMLDDKLAALVKRIVSDVIDWFDKNVTVSGEKGAVNNEENGTQHQPTNGTVNVNSNQRGRGYVFSDNVHTSPPPRNVNSPAPQNSTLPNLGNDPAGIYEYIHGVTSFYGPQLSGNLNPASTGMCLDGDGYHIQSNQNNPAPIQPETFGEEGVSSESSSQVVAKVTAPAADNPLVHGEMECMPKETGKDTGGACETGIEEAPETAEDTGGAGARACGRPVAECICNESTMEIVGAVGKGFQASAVVSSGKQSAGGQGRHGLPVECIGKETAMENAGGGGKGIQNSPVECIGKETAMENAGGDGKGIQNSPVRTPFDSGIMSIFLIHAHAMGGLDECFDFDVSSLDMEAKKLVTAIIMSGGV